MATSELNQFLENIDEEVLECAICFKRLQNPKSLNCLHSFCLTCLEDWVKAKGKLSCPTCSKSYSIPEGGLQKLPPNTFINNLLETIEKFSKDQMKCVCGKGDARYYCQECRHYLCSACSDNHQKFPMLHLVENVQSMSPLQIALLHYPLCFIHKEPLKFFCCNIPICKKCTVTDHKEREGKHKPIGISDAFQTFKETSAELQKAAHQCKKNLQAGLKAVLLNATKLQQNKDRSLRDIDSHVQIMVKKIKQNGDKMKKEVETIFKKKNKVLHDQIDELETTISDINTKLRFLNQLLKSDGAIALQSGERVSTALKDRINELPKTEPNDNAEIKYVINEKWIASLRQCDIGDILYMRAADCLTLKGEESVTLDQKIVIKVIKTDDCKTRANQLSATWTQPTGEINITDVEEDDNGDYFVTGKCTSPGVCKLDVSVDGVPIKQSPMIIKVEKEGLVNTIDINKEYVRDVVKCEDDCLLVSNMTNVILKYQQSGEYIGKVTLPQGVRVHRMYKMKNGIIAFSDYSKCIKICDMNGQVLKSIGQEVLKDPWGIHVDEVLNVVYVADLSIDWVYMFDICSGQVIRKIGSHGYQKGQISEVIDVTLTNQGHLLVLEYGNNRLQLFDNEGRFIKVLVKKGYEDGKVRYACGVVVDEDDNIIISDKQKLQLFSRDGKFIKRIDKESAGIQQAEGISIIAHKPRRFAVANNGDKTVKIFNY